MANDEKKKIKRRSIQTVQGNKKKKIRTVDMEFNSEKRESVADRKRREALENGNDGIKRNPNLRKENTSDENKDKKVRKFETVYENPNYREETEAEKVENKTVQIVAACLTILFVIIVLVIAAVKYVKKVDPNEDAGLASNIQVSLEGDDQSGYFAVKVYDSVIIGALDFVFENIESNTVDLCFSVVDDIDGEIFNSGYLAPGGGVSWDAKNVAGGRTYNCDVLVTSRNRETGEEGNSITLRQKYHIDKTLPKTTGPSAYLYLVAVDNYERIENATLEYNMCVATNPLHPAEEGVGLHMLAPETLTIDGNEFPINQIEYKKQQDQYLYMENRVAVLDVEEERQINVEYYISPFNHRDANAFFKFD